MNKLATIIATALLLALPSLAFSQREDVLELARAAENSPIEIRSGQVEAEDYIAAYRRGVWKKLDELFEPRGSNGAPRDYEYAIYHYVGASGLLTREQVEGFKRVADVLCEIPRGELSQEILDEVAPMFGWSPEELASRIDALWREEPDAAPEPREKSALTLFDAPLPDDMEAATDDELAEILARALQGKPLPDAFNEFEKLPPIPRARIMFVLLDRFGENQTDLVRAMVLRETFRLVKSLDLFAVVNPEYKGSPADLIETLAIRESESRPEAWQVALVAAEAIVDDLPKTAFPTNDPDAPFKRSRSVFATVKDGALSCAERDRVRALQILVRASDAALNALGEADESREGRFFLTLGGYFGYFAFLEKTLSVRWDSEEGKLKGFNVKTDLSALPPPRPTEDSLEVKPYADFYKEALFPNSLDEAENDKERVKWANYLGRAASTRFKSSALATLGSAVQESNGLRNLLVLSKYNANRAPSAEITDARREQLALLREIPTLPDDETALAIRVRDYEIDGDEFCVDDFRFERRKLVGAANYVALLKKAVELDEPPSALERLAIEYETRGRHKLAKEYWARAENAYKKELEKLESLDPNDPWFLRRTENGYGDRTRRVQFARDLAETGLKWIRERLRREALKPIFRFDPERSAIEGTAVKATINALLTDELEGTIYRLDLSSAIEEARAKRSDESAASGSVPGVVNRRVAKALGEGRALETLGIEICKTTLPVSYDASGIGPGTAILERELGAPGAYLIQVANKAIPDAKIWAIAFVGEFAPEELVSEGEVGANGFLLAPSVFRDVPEWGEVGAPENRLFRTFHPIVLYDDALPRGPSLPSLPARIEKIPDAVR
ncbi:MAG: hypothetical protein IJM30_03470 [Thermoguttaceae bacterium]|nr:hypothetical protein [Thermoguttaceae bacterium]